MASMDTLSRELMLDSLRNYAKKNLTHEFLKEMDDKNEFPTEILKEMYDQSILGVHLLLIPKEYGGISGGTFDVYRVCEVLARIDLGIATGVFATFLGTDPLSVGGTDDQKEEWMTRIAKENLLVAYAATEADAGSDLVNLRTRADHVLKNGELIGYKLTGNKQWISNGAVADVYSVLAMAPGGPSWFMVEKGTEGFSPNKHEDKHGIRLSNTAGLSFDDAYIPKKNLIGNVEGHGLLQAQAVFGYTRVMVAAFGLGCGWEALEVAIKYSQQRIQGGGPLSDKQGYTHKLIVPHAVDLEAARAYIEEISERLDGGEKGLQTEGAIAKYAATESGNQTAEDAIQALGGYGYTKDFSVEKIKRDVKIACIYEGTNEVMEMTIFRGCWQEHLKTRGQHYVSMAEEMDVLHSQTPEVGANSAALALRALAAILEECRIQRLTRHQYITFKLGKLISFAELAFIFARRSSADRYTETIKFDRNVWQTMSRVYAKNAALRIAIEGLALVLGAAEKDTDLAENLNLDKIQVLQKGLISDMDLIALKLKDTFKAK
ncbi:MAG: acyl-CoA dehydrogenase family protein [Elusimicrobia bacterium]|nr:acyl-CoA dehydrogenase family protein [Elusimicrobiota bacterium]